MIRDKYRIYIKYLIIDDKEISYASLSDLIIIDDLYK